MRRYLWAVIVVASFSTTALAAAPDLPDSSRTPGALNPDVTQANIKSNICKANWTQSIRFGETDLKVKQLEDWGYEDKDPSLYEEDHLISLQLGGAIDDPTNLWPEHYESGAPPYEGQWGAHVKDGLENELKRRICSAPSNPDHITLEEGRNAIAHDWKAAYANYVCTRKPKLTAIMAAHCP